MLNVSLLGQSISIDCPDPDAHALMEAGFAAMLRDNVAAGIPTAKLNYQVHREASGPSHLIARSDGLALSASGAGEAALAVESDIMLELQRRRPDLCFIHAAAVERNGKAWLLAAESGAGKSTTAWGLLHHGFRYLTDEFSPMDLDSLQVHPYPYALSFKTQPPEAYPLPEGALDLGPVVHLPTRCLPSPPVHEQIPVAGVFLLDYRPDRSHPAVRRLSVAEASARLYITVLNALAHSRCGLDAVVRIAENMPCFALATADLGATCRLIAATVADCEPSALAHGHTA
jgi:hypothetical protein